MRPEFKAIKKAISERLKPHYSSKISFSFLKKIEQVFVSDGFFKERHYVSLFSKEIELYTLGSASSFVIDFIYYDLASNTFEFSFCIRNKLNTFPESDEKNPPLEVELSRKRNYFFKTGKYFSLTQLLTALDCILKLQAQLEKKSLNLEILLGEKPGYTTFSWGYRSGANYSTLQVSSLPKTLFSDYMQRKWKNKTVRYRHEQVFGTNNAIAGVYYASRHGLELKNKNLFGKLNPKVYNNYYKQEKVEKLEKLAARVANDALNEYLLSAA